jgi:Lrp/AsnC family transcriptional regulator for asnA, asnC and gidA
MVRISNIDLIRELEKNPREHFTVIARKFNVSEAAIRKRIKNLLQLGIIRFSVEVDYKKVGYNSVAIIGIDTQPEHFIRVLEMLKRNKDIKDLYSSTGDHMILVKVVFKSSKELNNFIKRLEKNRAIKKVCPAIILERIK